LAAGPIDRVERFSKDLHADIHLTADAFLAGGKRIVLGLFMKFVLADMLALISLDGARAAQVHQPGWLWLLVYAYALRLFFDFAGYTHIAIGIAQWAGIVLPENFDHPYLKGSLTTFWNSWHITLAMWFRAYYFNPVSRALRTRKLPVPVIIAFTQVTTMLLIGLWHGITWNYAIWGLWHGVGLFINNRWQNATRARMRHWNENPRLKPVITVAGVLVTFHYVALGWVWFALPSLSLSVNTLLSLFGITA
jgi:D-alanyl-lipoteichoic acid acyltransferase DltB (MBOAT superfamily)